MTMRKQIPVLYSPYHKLHAPEVEFLNGRLIAYPEVPQRVEGMRDHLMAVELGDLIEPENPISKEEIARTHDRGMVDYLERMSDEVEDFLADEDHFYKVDHLMQEQKYFYAYVFPSRPFMTRMLSSSQGHHGFYCFDTEGPIGKGTWNAILFSATLAATGASLLLDSKTDCAYALCRPPGHHAGPDFFGGFCYFNNAAIAARRLLELGKVAVIDIDYHHGNGTQAIFWEEPRVFYGSIHADPDFEYPYYSGYSDETGGQNAEGTNMNIPLPRGAEGKKYLSALEQTMQRVSAFGPGSLVISVGFDTYIDEPLGFFRLTFEDYREIGASIARLGLPTLFVQEGGYNLEAQGPLAGELIRGFLGN